jgi:hypothetical protein
VKGKHNPASKTGVTDRATAFPPGFAMGVVDKATGIPPGFKADEVDKATGIPPEVLRRAQLIKRLAFHRDLKPIKPKN